MKLKALLAGALVGFLAAVAPSCSGSKCDAKSCTGCCSSSGQCVKTNNQDATCGPQGQACANCAATGQTCTAALNCSGAGDGGMTDGGPQTVMGTLGASCQVDGQCSNVVPKSTLFPTFCKKEATHPYGEKGLPYPDGHCTRRCFDDLDCSPDGGPSGTCITGLGFGILGETEGICVRGCETTGPSCRPGYTCYRFTQGSNNYSFCWLAGADGGQPPLVDAGQPGGATSKIGAACDSDDMCSPPERARCFKATLSDGGPSGYKDGNCSSLCDVGGNGYCGAGNACILYPVLYQGDTHGPDTVAWCEKRCSASAPCRSGYYCDVWSPTLGICTPRCDVPGNTCSSGVCNPNTGACGPRCDEAGGTCDSNSLCNTTSGVCELRCNVSDAGCTGGKTCDPGTGLCK